jgi:hypothetical protein
MTKFLTVALAAVAMMVAGCASSYSKNYRAYLAAEGAKPAPEKKPLLKITAQEGQPITGLASIEVYAPDASDAHISKIAPPVPEPSPAMQVAGLVKDTLIGLAVPGAQAFGMRQQTLLGIAQSNNAARSTESNNLMLTNIVGAGYTGLANTAAAGFRSNERLAADAFGAIVKLPPTTQITTGDGSPVTIGNANHVVGGRDNRQASPGPCVNTPTVTATTTPAPVSSTTGSSSGSAPATVTVTGSVPCTTN